MMAEICSRHAINTIETHPYTHTRPVHTTLYYAPSLTGSASTVCLSGVRANVPVRAGRRLQLLTGYQWVAPAGAGAST